MLVTSIEIFSSLKELKFRTLCIFGTSSDVHEGLMNEKFSQLLSNKTCSVVAKNVFALHG